MWLTEVPHPDCKLLLFLSLFAEIPNKQSFCREGTVWWMWAQLFRTRNRTELCFSVYLSACFFLPRELFHKTELCFAAWKSAGSSWAVLCKLVNCGRRVHSWDNWPSHGEKKNQMASGSSDFVSTLLHAINSELNYGLWGPFQNGSPSPDSHMLPAPELDGHLGPNPRSCCLGDALLTLSASPALNFLKSFPSWKESPKKIRSIGEFNKIQLNITIAGLCYGFHLVSSFSVSGSRTRVLLLLCHRLLGLQSFYYYLRVKPSDLNSMSK